MTIKNPHCPCPDCQQDKKHKALERGNGRRSILGDKERLLEGLGAIIYIIAAFIASAILVRWGYYG